MQEDAQATTDSRLNLTDLLSESCQVYVKRAISEGNRKRFDGDSNAPYRIVIEMAEVGSCENDPGGFWCEVKIPRQVDNELGMTIKESVSSRAEAARLLRVLAEMLDAG